FASAAHQQDPSRLIRDHGAGRENATAHASYPQTGASGSCGSAGRAIVMGLPGTTSPPRSTTAMTPALRMTGSSAPAEPLGGAGLAAGVPSAFDSTTLI